MSQRAPVHRRAPLLRREFFKSVRRALDDDHATLAAAALVACALFLAVCTLVSLFRAIGRRLQQRRHARAAASRRARPAPPGVAMPPVQPFIANDAIFPPLRAAGQMIHLTYAALYDGELTFDSVLAAAHGWGAAHDGLRKYTIGKETHPTPADPQRPTGDR